MQSITNAGSAANGGLIQQQISPLPRLNPRQIAVMLLPTEKEPVSVEHATDAQFQKFVTACGLAVADDESEEWSFDDRCRLINHGRKYGIDIFAELTQNNSEEKKNNSDQELFVAAELASGGR